MQVAKLLMDTSVFEFYPTLFVLVTDIMDMLGDLVWQRIKRKAEFTEDGALLCNLAGILFCQFESLAHIMLEVGKAYECLYMDIFPYYGDNLFLSKVCNDKCVIQKKILQHFFLLLFIY